ncbi:MAG: hypothetical protein ACREXI_04845 [Caldimonas sp.]
MRADGRTFIVICNRPAAMPIATVEQADRRQRLGAEARVQTAYWIAITSENCAALTPMPEISCGWNSPRLWRMPIARLSITARTDEDRPALQARQFGAFHRRS